MRYLITLLLFVCSNAFALDVLIYHNNYSDTYTNVKAQMESDGHTVTGSTSTTVASNLIQSYDVVIDLLYNNNCGATCRGNYDDFVKDGGTLIITGENESYFSSRNANIESLIENKFGGTLTIGNASGTVNSFNSTYTDNTSTYTLAGGGSLSGDGVWVAKVGTTVVWMTWQGSDLPTGYTGAVYVTADINQFQNTYGGSAAKALYSDLVAYSGSSSSPTTSTTTGTSGGITSAQSANKSSARTRSNSQSDNTVYIDQVGDNNTVTIEQDGTATNTIRGIYSSGDDAGLIQGDSNTIEIRQGAATSTDSNLIEFKIIGSSNDVLLYQDRLNTGYEDTQAGGGHNIILDINGSTNDIDIIQRNNYSTNGGHFVDLEVIGSSNGIDLKQISDYSKDIFGKVTGSNNSVTVYQHEDSNKYLDFDLTGNGHTLDVEQTGTGAHNAEITLINGTAPSTVNLLQQGSTDQSYSLEQTCYTTGGCTVDVTQGN